MAMEIFIDLHIRQLVGVESVKCCTHKHFELDSILFLMNTLKHRKSYYCILSNGMLFKGLYRRKKAEPTY